MFTPHQEDRPFSFVSHSVGHGSRGVALDSSDWAGECATGQATAAPARIGWLLPNSRRRHRDPGGRRQQAGSSGRAHAVAHRRLIAASRGARPSTRGDADATRDGDSDEGRRDGRVGGRPAAGTGRLHSSTSRAATSRYTLFL